MNIFLWCQCPQSCFLHFYLIWTCGCISVWSSVNALSRAFFISTMLWLGGITKKSLYQCPQSCFLHFYFFTSIRLLNQISVSMPSVVLSSFLPQKNQIMHEHEIVCQCPQSCFLHFYNSNCYTSRLPVFGCQCPQSCFLHFY